MGVAHSQGWRVAPRFYDLSAQPEMTLLVGRNARGVEAAGTWGWQKTATDWRTAIARDDSGGSHAETAIAALEAGKHVRCEKPLANTSKS